MVETAAPLLVQALNMVQMQLTLSTSQGGRQAHTCRCGYHPSV